MQTGSLFAMVRALQDAGIIFIDADGQISHLDMWGGNREWG